MERFDLGIKLRENSWFKALIELNWKKFKNQGL
jgi:hypothetical protein